jgi:DHA1 family tetracycline resistance protein-like MFS transporter
MNSKKAMLFILITVLIDTIGFGIVAPVTPELIMELTGQPISEAALYGGWLMFLYALTQFFAAPILGNLSDRFGRRPVLIASLFTLGLDYLLMAFAPTLEWLFVGRAIAGVAGATFATANAYIADISDPEMRAQNFGLLGSAWGFGFILGPVIGGLLGEYGSRVPFFAAAALAGANVLYGLFVLPESLPTEARRAFSFKRANPIGALAQMRKYPGVLLLFGALVLYQLAHDANPSTWTYYTMLKFGWSERDVGLSMGVLGISIVVVQGLLIRIVIPKLGDRMTVLLGLAVMATGYLGFSLAGEGWVMLVFIVPFALGSLAMPALRSILSHRVGADAQGELQGAMSSLMSLTAIVAPVFLTQLFGYFSSASAPVYFPGAPFMTAAVLTMGSAVVVAGVLFSRRQPALG